MRGEMAFRDTFSPQFDPSDFFNFQEQESIAL
jgi:hypothetical protein